MTFLLLLSLSLLHSAHALRSIQSQQNFLLEQALTAGLESKEAIGAEVIETRFILAHTLQAAETRSQAIRQYERFKANHLNFALQGELLPSAYDDFMEEHEPGLFEAVINLIQHGRGGEIMVYRFRKTSQNESGILIRLADRGPGIESPNELLHKSWEMIEKYEDDGGGGAMDASDVHGVGFGMITVRTPSVDIDSLGKHWEKRLGENGHEYVESPTPSLVTSGAVVTLRYNALSGDRWKKPFSLAEISLGDLQPLLAVGLEEGYFREQTGKYL